MRPLLLVIAILWLFPANMLRAQCVPTVSRSGSSQFGNSRTLAATPILDSIKIKLPGYTDSLVATGNSISFIHKQCGPFTIGVRLYGQGCAPFKDTLIADTAVSTFSPSIAISPGVGCANDNFTFTCSVTNGTNYLWTIKEGSSIIKTGSNNPYQSSFSFTGNSTHSLTSYLTFTDVNGCQLSTSAPFAVQETPDAAIVDDFNSKQFTNCGGGNLTVHAVDVSSTSNSRYVINWGDGLTPFDSAGFRTDGLSHVYSGIGIFNISLEVYNSFGCKSSKTYQAFNGSIPTGEIGYQTSPPSVTCGPYSINFLLNNNSGNPAGTTYSIFFSDTQDTIVFQHPAPASVSHQFSKPSCGYNTPAPNSFQNAYYVELTTSNPCDVSTSKLAPIRIQDSIHANIDASDSIVCINGTLTFSDSTFGNYFQSINGQNSSCSSEASIYWSISDPSAVNIISGKYGKSAKRVLKTQWGSKNLSLQFIKAGNFTLKLIKGNTDDNDCNVDSVSINICVQDPAPPVFTLPEDSICAGSTLIPDNLSPTICKQPLYSWSSVRSTNSTCPDNPAVPNSTISAGSATSFEPTFLFNNPGTYTISLSYTDACPARSTTQTVVVKDKPVVSLPSFGTYCETASITPTSTVDNCSSTFPVSYAWSFNGGFPASSSLANPGNIDFNTTGTKTISLNVSNECGSRSTSGSLTINPAPLADAGKDTVICGGTSVNIGCANVSTSTYSWTPTTGLNNPTISNPVFTKSNTSSVNDTVYLKQIVSSASCTKEDSIMIVVKPIPPVPAENDTARCDSGFMQLMYHGPGTANWRTYPGDSLLHSGNTYGFNLTSTIRFYIQSSLNNCIQPTKDVIQVTKYPFPVVDAGLSLTSCANSTTPLALLGSPAGGTWSGTGVSGSQFDPTISGPGSFVLNYSFTNSTGCTNKDSLTITVYPPPSVNAGPDVSICANAPDTIIKAVIPASGGNWSGPGIQSNGLFRSPSVVASGYQAVFSYTDNNSCTNTDTIIISTRPIPAVDAGNDLFVCIDTTAISLLGNPSGGSWSGSGISNSNGTFTASSTTSGYHTIYYKTDSINGCSNIDSLIIDVRPLPMVTAFADTTICLSGNSIQLSAFPAGGNWSGSANISNTGSYTTVNTGTEAVNYFYRDPVSTCKNTASKNITTVIATMANAGRDTAVCINSPVLQLTGLPANGIWQSTPKLSSSGVFTPDQSGSYKLVYQTGSGNCLTTDTVDVIVNALPVVDAGSDAAICINSPDTLLNPLTPTGGGNWSGSGINNTGLFSPSTGAGNHVLTYTFTDIKGCVNQDNRNVQVNSLPVINVFAPDTNICNQPIPVHFTATPAGGKWIGLNISSTGLFTPNGTGIFTIGYTVLNASGCADTAYKNIHVLAPPAPDAGRDTLLCHYSSSYQLNGTPASPNGIWQSTSKISSSGLFTPDSVGIFKLVYDLGLNNCLTHDTVQIEVNPLPTVIIDQDYTTCINADDTLLKSYSPITGGSWSGPCITPAGLFKPCEGGIVYQLIFTLSDVHNCINKDTLLVNVIDLVNIFAPDTTICDQPIPVQFSASPAGGIWLGNHITSSGLFTSPGTGNYTIRYTVANDLGCRDTASKIVHVVTPIIPFAGLDQQSCVGSPTIQLNGTPTGPDGVWQSTSQLNSTGQFDPNTVGIYTLVYDLGSGNCLTHDTLLFTVHDLPVVDAGPDVTVCVNATDTLLQPSTSTGGNWSGNGISANGNFDPSVGPGNFVVNYSYTDINGCVNSDNRNIIINDLPNIDVFAPDTTICDQPIPVQLSATPFGGTWIGNKINSSGLFSPSGTGDHRVAYTISNGFGCRDTVDKILHILAPVIPNAGGDVSICHNAPPIQLNASPTIPNGSWKPTPQLTSSGLFTPNAPGVYPLIYNLASGNCLTHDTLIATVHPNPIVNAGSDFSTCVNSPDTQLTSVSPLSGGVWSGPGVSPNGVFRPSTGIGTYTLTCTYIDFNSCTDSDTRTIIVNGLPVINLNGTDTTICDQAIPVSFNASPFGGNWSGTGISSGGTFTPNGTGDYTIYYTIFNSLGCSDTANKTVHVVSPTVPNAGGDLSICHHSSPIQLTTTPAGGQWQANFQLSNTGLFSPEATGNWPQVYDFGTGNCLTHDTVIIKVNPLPVVNAGNDLGLCLNSPDTILQPSSAAGGIWNGTGVTSNGRFSSSIGTGSYALNYTYTDANGCSGTDDRMITVNPLPVINIGSDTTICNRGIPVVFNAYPLGGYWFGNNILYNGIYTPPGSGTYTVYYTVINQFGCKDTAQKNITIANSYFADAGNDSIVCYGGGTVHVNGLPAGGSWQTTSYNDSNGNFTPIGTGSYALVYEYGSGNCITADTSFYRVLQSPVADFTIPPINNCISPTLITPTNTSQNAIEFTWIVDGLYYYGFQPTIIINSTGIHSIKLIANNQNICFDSTLKSITIVPPFEASFTMEDSICQNETLIPVNTSTGGTQFEWLINGVPYSTEREPIFNFTESGDHLIQLIATDNGCSDSLDLPYPIRVGELPQVGFNLIPEVVYLNDQHFIIDCAADNYSSMFYEVASTLYDSCNTEVFTQFPAPGKYPVYQNLISVDGCTNQTVKYIEVYSDQYLYVPNAFTPDNDDRNDEFQPSIYGYRSYELWIFDRWGKQVFHTTDMSAKWDGTNMNNHEECRPDVYPWRIVVDDMYGERTEHTGHVVLVK